MVYDDVHLWCYCKFFMHIIILLFYSISSLLVYKMERHVRIKMKPHENLFSLLSVLKFLSQQEPGFWLYLTFDIYGYSHLALCAHILSLTCLKKILNKHLKLYFTIHFIILLRFISFISLQCKIVESALWIFLNSIWYWYFYYFVHEKKNYLSCIKILKLLSHDHLWERFHGLYFTDAFNLRSITSLFLYLSRTSY